MKYGSFLSGKAFISGAGDTDIYLIMCRTGGEGDYVCVKQYVCMFVYLLLVCLRC